MQLFGGDPRIVFLKIMLDANKWYAVIIIVMFLLLCLRRSDDKTFLLIYIMFAVVEIIRLLLSISFVSGEVSVFTAFLVITAIPLIVLDFIWLFFVETRTGFDYVTISGMIVFHILELFALGILQLIQLSKYQSSFFRFQYGYRSIGRAEEPSDVEMQDID